MPNSLPSVALVGKQGSGKSTFAELLVTRHGYMRHSWAGPIRHVFELAYDRITADTYQSIKATKYPVKVLTPEGIEVVEQRTGGELLQLIGTEAIRNQVDRDFWIKVGVRAIYREMVVNDDTRYLNEVEALRGLGWVVVRVVAPDTLRRERLGAGYRPEGHTSETEQEKIAEDFTLVNDGVTPVEELLEQLLEFLRSVDTSFAGKAARALSSGVL